MYTDLTVTTSIQEIYMFHFRYLKLSFDKAKWLCRDL